jgi:hypothetical protein
MRLVVAGLVSVAFIAAWAAVAWLVMLITLYIVRLVPMTGWAARGGKAGRQKAERQEFKAGRQKGEKQGRKDVERAFPLSCPSTLNSCLPAFHLPALRESVNRRSMRLQHHLDAAVLVVPEHLVGVWR